MPEEREWKYTVEFKREAVKGQDGFKVTAHDDDDAVAMSKAVSLYKQACEQVAPLY